MLARNRGFTTVAVFTLAPEVFFAAALAGVLVLVLVVRALLIGACACLRFQTAARTLIVSFGVMVTCCSPAETETSPGGSLLATAAAKDIVVNAPQ